jgi:8-oxo-dGTP pyrophosphatase MutT (NUDIX family)
MRGRAVLTGRRTYPMTKANVKLKSASKGNQYAAIPIRFTEQGQLEVLLVTSRGSKKWLVPKGWPIPKLAAHASAAREAFEEAGIEGAIRPRSPIGSYQYFKRVDANVLQIKVKVFILWAARQLETWPEQTERLTKWFSPEDAADAVEEKQLATLLLGLPDMVRLKGA